mgnify:FL=1
MSQWADQNRVLSSETSASPGSWITYNFQRAMMDAFSDPKVEQVVIMSGSQLGKTEILLNVLGYHIALDPSPIMIIQPTLSMAGSFSKNRITPMIRDCAVLNEKVKDPRARDSGNTVYSKSFNGGSLDLIGSNSPSSASSRPVRLLLCDEVDRYSLATTEGDIIGLGKRRTSNFFNRKIGMVSTPTIKGESRIEEFYLQGDQNEYWVRCPDCGDEQLLEWSGVNFEKDNGILKDAFYVCSGCGSPWSDSKRLQAVNNGTWKPSAEFSNIRSFNISALYSPWTSIFEQAVYFHQVKDYPEKLKVFVNTVLCQLWDDDAGESIDGDKLKARSEDFGDKLPTDVVLLTAGIDTQDDRLEVSIVGYTRDETIYIIDHHILYGDPSGHEVWKDLDELLQKKYKHPKGVELSVRVSCIDSGGHHTAKVYDYVKTREVHRIFAIKGVGGERPVVSRPTKNNIGKIRLFPVGVDTTKSLLYSRLKLDEGIGMIHISSHLDNEYFEQLCSEKRVEKYSKGVRKTVWVKSRQRNEAWDCLQYAYAGLHILNVNLRLLHEKMNRPKDTDKNEKTIRPKPFRSGRSRWMDT